tara:strand:- start:5001 stop:6728 length:1728 start_codon:yes stop_codon:yes gene_type:complete
MMVSSTPKFSGEPTAEALANGLATLGRYGDNYMVHAAEGETMVPKEILEANPGLKAELFQQMTMMGIKDPNRYVVGNSLNSINPITGQPEFFFKKIWKAIKKIGKKVLPIVAPILGNMLLPGIGGILASMAVTKLQGGSWGDALKSGLMSYGASALGSGLAGGFSSAPGQTFMGGLGKGLSAPFDAASNLFSQTAANPLAQGLLGPKGAGLAFSSLKGTNFANQGIGLLPQYQSSEALSAMNIDPMTGVQHSPTGATPTGVAPLTRSGLQQASTSGFERVQLDSGQFALLPSSEVARIEAAQGFAPGLDGSRRLTAGASSLVSSPQYQQHLSGLHSQASAAGTGAGAGPRIGQEITTSSGTKMVWDGGKLVELASKAAAKPGLLEKAAFEFGPPLALAGLTYAMSDDEKTTAQQLSEDSANPKRIAYEEWSTIQDKESPRAKELYLTWFGTPSYSTAELASKFGAGTGTGATGLSTAVQPSSLQSVGLGPGILSAIQQGPFGSSLTPNTVSPMVGASGGEVFGPGTGTSDSIPARLSDGEFVMTAEAVRNAGGGDRSLGAARMYDMMNRFERGVA